MKQKQQIVRKPRKLFSRDRSGQLHKTHRQSQRQSEDKRVCSPVVVPQQKIIKGLRNQLTNLKEEVAKLTSREQKKPLEKNQIYMEYKGYIDQQNMQQINVKYSKDGKVFRREYKKSERVKSDHSSEGEQTILKKQSGKNQAKMEEIIKQFKEFKLQNKQLMAENEKLRADFSRIQQKLKYSQQDHQKNQKHQIQIIEKSKSKHQNLQNASSLFQKQNNQQKLVIQELKSTLESVTQSNILLKKEIQLLRETSIKTELLQHQLALKDKEILLLNSQLQEKAQIIHQKEKLLQQKALQLQNQKDLATKLNQQRIKQIQASSQNKFLMVQMKSKIAQLQKKLLNRQSKSQKDIKAQSNPTRQVAELQQIIRLQQKSMNNYESDLNYLEKELKKSQHFKFLNEKLTHLVEQANQQCLILNLHMSNNKYRLV